MTTSEVVWLSEEHVTEVRTAAVSVASVRALARRDIRYLGVLGSGVQARSHITQFLAEGWVERVSVWGPSTIR